MLQLTSEFDGAYAASFCVLSKYRYLYYLLSISRSRIELRPWIHQNDAAPVPQH
jgi:hypothetical protein